MAIETTIFYNSRAGQMQEVFEWLKDNASEYFDSITFADGVITCALENGAKFEYKSGTNPSINLKSGLNKLLYDTSAYIKKGIKTSKGIMLLFSSNYQSLIFSKTNKGTTCTSLLCKTSSNANLYQYFADLSLDVVFTERPNSINSSNIEKAAISSEKTSLVPISFANPETYAPDMLFTPFSQYSGMQGIIEVDGVKYAYDGTVALRE